MPNLLISHQTPGFLIKIRYPTKFDGVALCIGAMVPDFNGLIDTFIPMGIRNISHSLLGLIVWTLPFSLILTILFSRYVGPWISRLAERRNLFSNILRYFGMEDLHYLQMKQFNRRFFIVASFSSIIGGLTHLLLDLPSHEYIELFYPWVLLSYPELLSIPLIVYEKFIFGSQELVITQFTLIWTIEDSIFFVSSLFLLRYIKKHNLISKWYHQYN